MTQKNHSPPKGPPHFPDLRIGHDWLVTGVLLLFLTQNLKKMPPMGWFCDVHMLKNWFFCMFKRLWNEAGVLFHSRQVKELGSVISGIYWVLMYFWSKMLFEYHVKMSGLFCDERSSPSPTCTTSWKIFWSHESSQQNARANLAAWNVFQIHSWSGTFFFRCELQGIFFYLRSFEKKKRQW